MAAPFLFCAADIAFTKDCASVQPVLVDKQSVVLFFRETMVATAYRVEHQIDASTFDPFSGYLHAEYRVLDQLIQ
jgi:hypothetical protein